MGKGIMAMKKVKYGLNTGFRHGFKNVLFSKFFFGFITSLSVLISSHDKGGRIKDSLDAKFNDQEDTFDFIVGKWSLFHCCVVTNCLISLLSQLGVAVPAHYLPTGFQKVIKCYYWRPGVSHTHSKGSRGCRCLC